MLVLVVVVLALWPGWEDTPKVLSAYVMQLLYVIAVLAFLYQYRVGIPCTTPAVWAAQLVSLT